MGCPKTAAAYRQVWLAVGSPLLVYTREQTNAVRQRLSDMTDTLVHVALGTLTGAIKREISGWL